MEVDRREERYPTALGEARSTVTKNFVRNAREYKRERRNAGDVEQSWWG
jgi:hypothetical protein